jgi:hypothetical protein
MFKFFATAFVIAAVTCASIIGIAFTASSAQASGAKRLDDLATCLAFAFVKNDLDGVKEVPSELVPGIMAIKDEFLFEASVSSLDDNSAQTLVVERLLEMNKIKQASGIEEVSTRYLPLCREVGESLAEPENP